LWGGPLRGEAATQFFIYTMAGSVALLLAFLALYLCAGTFDFQRLAGLGRTGALTQAISENLGWRDLTTRNVTLVIFGAAFLGFAVKVPLFPFHTWLPLTYAEAPTGVTMMLTGLMSKMGVYGFLRILLPIFPIQTHWMAGPLLGLATLGIVLSAAAAWAQRDSKRMLAYSSINHLGYCMLGIFAMGVAVTPQTAEIEKAAIFNGVALQMFNHGLTAAMLFWFAGILERRSGGLRGVEDFGGVRQFAPVLCGLMGIALFSSLGLPGLNGFIGEFLIFKGTFALAKFAAAVSMAGLLLTAIFILSYAQKVFWGPARAATFADLSRGEILMLCAPTGLMFFLGVYPQALIRFLNGDAVEYARSLGF
jgi:NADH-quinone oxidoreductase subunit M